MNYSIVAAISRCIVYKPLVLSYSNPLYCNSVEFSDLYLLKLSVFVQYRKCDKSLPYSPVLSHKTIYPECCQRLGIVQKLFLTSQYSVLWPSPGPGECCWSFRFLSVVMTGSTLSLSVRLHLARTRFSFGAKRNFLIICSLVTLYVRMSKC